MKEYLVIGLAIALGLTSLALAGTWHALGIAHESLATVQGQHNQFIAGVKKIREAALADKAAALNKQLEIHNATTARLETSLGSINAKYARMRDAQSGGNSSSGQPSVPPVPDTARPADDAARDSRLLAVLQHAEIQTGYLVKFQQWAADSADSCGKVSTH